MVQFLLVYKCTFLQWFCLNITYRLTQSKRIAFDENYEENLISVFLSLGQGSENSSSAVLEPQSELPMSTRTPVYSSCFRLLD